MTIHTFMNPGIRDILSTGYPRGGMLFRSVGSYIYPTNHVTMWDIRFQSV